MMNRLYSANNRSRIPTLHQIPTSNLPKVSIRRPTWIFSKRTSIRRIRRRTWQYSWDSTALISMVVCHHIVGQRSRYILDRCWISKSAPHQGGVCQRRAHILASSRFRSIAATRLLPRRSAVAARETSVVSMTELLGIRVQG